VSKDTQTVLIKNNPYSDDVDETVELDGIKINAEDILQYLRSTGFNGNLDVGVSEFCPYGEARRLDLFYFSRWNRETRGYEIKVSRSDFLADKKWREYLKYCRVFYFVAPAGIIKPSELPPEIGLIEIDIVQKPNGSWQTRNNPDDEKSYYLTHKFTKRCKKLPQLGEKEYLQLLEGLLIKLIYRKNIQL
jgi:hypothetical protein